jgi:hypothetical protein
VAEILAQLGLSGANPVASSLTFSRGVINFAFSIPTSGASGELRFPLTTDFGNDLLFNSNSISGFYAPLLQNVNGDFKGFNNQLKVLSIPGLLTTGANVAFDSNPLVSVDLGLVVFADGGVIAFDTCALNQVSVDYLLHRCLLSGLTTSEIRLNGGTNSTPGVQGLLDKAALILAGNTVSTN